MKVKFLPLISLFAVACSQAPQQADTENWLVTLNAASATVDITANTITLTNVVTPTVFSVKPDHDVIAFPADTTFDQQSVTPLTFLAKIWDPANRKAPPNAVFSSGGSEIIVEVTSAPTLNGNNLVLPVKFLSGKPGSTQTYQTPTITVDNWRDCFSMVPRCTFSAGVLTLGVLNPLTLAFMPVAKLADWIADLGLASAAGGIFAKQAGMCLSDICNCFDPQTPQCLYRY